MEQNKNLKKALPLNKESPPKGSVPFFETAVLVQFARILKVICQHGIAGILFGKRSPSLASTKEAIASLGNDNPPTWRYWTPFIGLSLVGATFLWPHSKVLSALCSLAALFLTLGAAAIHRLHPTPRLSSGLSNTRSFTPYDKRTGLISYEKNIWVAQMPFVFHKLRWGARMVIAAYKRDKEGIHCFVYSPIQLTDKIRKEIVRLNLKIDYICGPNCLHHLFLGEWKAAFPNCKMIAAPHLKERRSDLTFDDTFNIEKDDSDGKVANIPEPLRSSSNLRFNVVKTGLFYEEIVLFAREDKVLVVADLIENLGYLPETKSRWFRFVLGLFGIERRPSLPTNFKLTVNRRRYRASIERIIAWDFECIIVAHGRFIEENAKNVFIAANAFVL